MERDGDVGTESPGCVLIILFISLHQMHYIEGDLNKKKDKQ